MTPDYTIVTVADFFAVPSNRRLDCLTDFLLWTLSIETVRNMGAPIEFETDKFEWIDDGKHTPNLVIMESESE